MLSLENLIRERQNKSAENVARTIAGFVGSVFNNDVRLIILEIAQREQDDVSLVNPDLLAHLPSNMRQSFLPIKAHRF